MSATPLRIELPSASNEPPCAIVAGRPLSPQNCAELTAFLRVSGLPSTDRGWRKKYKGRDGDKEGKAKLIEWDLLPGELRAAIKRYELRTMVSGGSALSTEVEPAQQMADLNDKQRARMLARLTVVRYIEDLGIEVGESKAVETFMEQQASCDLPEYVAEAVRNGHGKPRKNGDVAISDSTVYAWLSAACNGVAALATKSIRCRAAAAWAPLLMKIWGRPQKPSQASCHRKWSKEYPGVPAPSLKQIERYLKSLPKEVREYGRHSRNARRATQPFTRRITDGLWPMDVVVVDGHLFKSYVQHPVTGKPFRPEITTYMDAATRKIVGVSLGIAESKETIWMALKDMIHTNRCGVPAIQYSDRGAYKGIDHRATMERIGTTLMFAEPHRPQSRGLIERLNQFYIEMAKEFETYCGKDTDQEHFKKALKIAKEGGANIPTWDESVANLSAWKEEYNNRVHRAIGKTPNQAWQEAEQEGWRPTLLDDDDLYDLLPCAERTCIRGEIKMPWGIFYADDLRPLDGQRLRAHYDYDTGDRIWIADLEGRFICTALRGGNAKPYIADTARELAEEKRTEARLKRNDKKRAQILDEGRSTLPADPLLALMLAKSADAIEIDQALLAHGSDGERELSRDEQEEIDSKNMGRWLDIESAITAGDAVGDADIAFHDKFKGSGVWKRYMIALEGWTREELRI